MSLVKEDIALSFRQTIIVGAGIAGIDMACALKTKLQCEDFVIYDRNFDIGGTWCDNNYPGCAVDIPGFIYQLSYATEVNFPCVFPSRAEILAYLKRVAGTFDLFPHIQTGKRWISSTWLERESLWEIRLQDVISSQTYTQKCKLLIGAIGHMVDPKDFNVPGQQKFRGQIVASSKYSPDIDLKGKNVVVVGAGSTAVQVIPSILEQVKSCTQIQREPHWILHRPNPKISQGLRTFFGRFPVLFWILQHFVFAVIECFYPVLGSRLVKMAGVHQAKAAVPDEYHSLLTPSYKPGCKRLVFATDYLQCLKNPKFNLVQDTVTSLDTDNVATKSGGKYAADVIILCHGFKAETFYYPLKGRNGLSPVEHWDKAGGPSCYKGVAMNGFPNFFCIRGPNVASGHQSQTWFIEASTALICNVAKPLLCGDVDAVEVTAKAEDTYVKEVQDACRKGFWGQDCRSYYVTETGWNHTVYPWTPYYLFFHRFVEKTHWRMTQAPVLNR